MKKIIKVYLVVIATYLFLKLIGLKDETILKGWVIVLAAENLGRKYDTN